MIGPLRVHTPKAAGAAHRRLGRSNLQVLFTVQAKGAIKEAAGKAIDDVKLTAEGKSDKVEGKIQNAVGGLKDALKK